MTSSFFETRSPPGLLAPTLVTLPSMSHVPRAPFFLLVGSSSSDVTIQRFPFQLFSISAFSFFAKQMLNSLLSLPAAAGECFRSLDATPMFPYKLESAMRTPKTQSIFHLHTRRNAFYRDTRQPTEPEKTFLCMDLSRRTRTQNQ